jgi:DNA-binding FadR family transcriptional regulator
VIRLRDRLIAWFAVNPEEELTREDIQLRWGASRQSALETLQTLRADGLIETSRHGVNGFGGLGNTHVHRASKQLRKLHHAAET